jgi:hypothetical protein
MARLFLDGPIHHRKGWEPLLETLTLADLVSIQERVWMDFGTTQILAPPFVAEREEDGQACLLTSTPVKGSKGDFNLILNLGEGMGIRGLWIKPSRRSPFP